MAYTKKSSSGGKITPAKKKKIVDQVLLEIEFARDYKKKRIEQWHKNEKLLSHIEENLKDQRSNIGIANTKSNGFVDTLLSKVDSAPNIKFVKGSEADLLVAKHYNNLFSQEMSAEKEDLDFKDLLGKKDAIIYGRAIYDYHASSQNGYSSHLNLVSPYDFLIDPSAGGMYIEKARYLGRAGVWKDKWQLQQGVKAGLYNKSEVEKIIKGGAGQADRASIEQKDKEDGIYYLSGERKRRMENSNQWHFHEWGTTYEGERYLVLVNEQLGVAPRVELLSDVFAQDKWWFWSWATNLDSREFWTLSPLDNMRKIFITQGINIDQALDNNERINEPMIGVVAGAVKSLNDLRYGRGKRVLFKKGTDMRNATKVFETPQIDNPLAIYDKLESIGNLESGVNADAKGASEEDKVGIYEGNIANLSDRLGLLNKSYARGYKSFAELFKYGVEEHVTKKIAIEFLGSDGAGYEEVKPKDLQPRKRLRVVVEASDAEIQSDIKDKQNKLAFLASKAGDPAVNQKVRFEMEAQIAGLKKEDIERLLDVENEASAELMSEAADEIEKLISGEKVEPNWQANTKFAQKILDYMNDNKTELNEDQWSALENYLIAIQPIVVRNSVRAAQSVRSDALRRGVDITRGGDGATPLQGEQGLQI